MNKLLIAALLAVSGSVGMLARPAIADDVIVVRREPPPLRDEAVPEARRGYVWAPGYWNWNGNRFVWVRGKWVRERYGYYWRSSSWEARDGRWHMHRGGWARNDRDDDGIPNRVDRDRDNDGVPNRYDAHPNDPDRR